MPTALAMLAGVSVEKVFETIGHDGSQILWPQYDDPFRRQSFCDNEIVFAAFEFGIGLVELSEKVKYHPYGEEEGAIDVDIDDQKTVDLLSRYDALVLGVGTSGVPHAVAWNHRKQLIFDPNGSRYNPEFFGRQSVYLAVPVGLTIGSTIRKEEL
jgi:hypothetical protein